MTITMNIINIIKFFSAAAASFTIVSCNNAADLRHNEAETEPAHNGEIIFSEAQAAAAGLRLESIEPGDFRNVIKTGGHLETAFQDQSVISATAAGIISLRPQTAFCGAYIGADDIFATISSSGLPDGDKGLQAKIEYEASEREFIRSEALAEAKIISLKDFEKIRQRYETARAVYQGQADRLAPGGVRVVSSMGGFIDAVEVMDGDYVSLGDRLATVVRTEKLRLVADLSVSDLGSLGRVTTANFRPIGEERTISLSDLGGRLLSYGKTADASSGFVPVIFEFENVGSWMPGTFAETFLLTDTRAGILSLPRSALTEEQGIFSVYVQVPDERDAFIKKEVKTGMDNGERVEITDGLSIGDLVVVEGAYQVKLASLSSVVPEGHSH